MRRSASLALGLAVCLWAADEESGMLPDGPEKATVIKVCTVCHGVGSIRKRRLNRQEWDDKVSAMVDKGADGTDQEFDAVVEYLARNFGKDSKVLVNTAPLEELISILGLNRAEGDAVIAWRKEKGNFKAWQDLLKVPGVDGKKIEGKKDAMAF